MSSVMLCGCGGGAPGAASTTPAGSSSTLVGPSTAGAGAGGSTGAGSANGATSCTAGALTASIAAQRVHGGAGMLTVALRNVSSQSCSLVGFPGVQLLDASGTALATAVERAGSSGDTDVPSLAVKLAPGGEAWLRVTYSDGPGSPSSCSAAAAIAVTPPGATQAVTLQVALVACDDGSLVVSPVFAARSGGRRGVGTSAA